MSQNVPHKEQSKRGLPLPPRWVTVLAVVLAALVLAAEFGLHFGVSNQNTYLLEGLRLYDSDLLASDWLASETTSFHTAFSWVAAALFALPGEGIPFAAANVLCIIALVVFIYQLAGLPADRRSRLYVFLLVMLFVYATKTVSVLQSYIASHIFQPSTLGALGLMGAFVLFLKREYFWSGVLLAAGGLSHVNYLMLGFFSLGLAHLILGRRELLTRLSSQFVLPVLAFLTLAPIVVEAGFSPLADQARWIYQEFRAPHHYMTLRYLPALYPFFGWTLAGLVLGWSMLLGREAIREVRSLYISMIVLIVLATGLTTIAVIPQVSQLYLLRLTPYAMLFSQAALAFAIVNILRGQLPAGSPGVVALRIFLAVAGMVLAIRQHYPGHHALLEFTFIALAIMVAMQLVGLLFRKRTIIPVRVTAILIVCLWIGGSVRAVEDFPARSTLIRGLRAADVELFEWAQTTPVISVFLTPPHLEHFRLHAHRAVIVDIKSHPYAPNELVEWYHRLEVVSGVSNPANPRVVDSGFGEIDLGRLRVIHTAYPFNYVVVPSPWNGERFAGLPVAFDNGRWKVLSWEETVPAR